MMKLTLDTNCVINLLDFKAETPTSVDELSEIIRYGLDGDVNIAITTRVESDVDGDKDTERKAEMVRKIRMFPVIGTGARLDVSKFDSGDFLVDEKYIKYAKEIQTLLFPTLDEKERRYKNKINDIDHIVGHCVNKRDIFVTDDQEILRRADKLKEGFGIVVMNPTQCLEYLDLRARSDVLAQQILDKIKSLYNLIMSTVGEKITKEMEIEYSEIRDWLLRKYPKIQDGLLAFRHRMRSVPVGTQRVFNQVDMLNLQEIPLIYEALYKERSLEEKCQKLFPTFSHYPMGPATKRRELDKQFGWAVDLLTSYVGFLEK